MLSREQMWAVARMPDAKSRRSYARHGPRKGRKITVKNQPLDNERTYVWDRGVERFYQHHVTQYDLAPLF